MVKLRRETGSLAPKCQGNLGRVGKLRGFEDWVRRRLAEQGASTSAAQTAQQAAANANQRNNLFAATLSRANPSGAQQGLQPLSGDIGVGPGSNGQPQAQRLTDTPQPQRAKPQLPPRFVSDQVSVQVQRAIGQGNDRISIQLKPAELGRVEVKLEIAHDGKVNAVISAERPETLELLKQDARSLQQSLQQAGLNADSSSLSFNLQQRGGAFEQALGRNGGQQSNDADNQGTTDDTDQQAAGSRNIISDDMVDVEV
jgi:flagellar hook-length control protein FliK